MGSNGSFYQDGLPLTGVLTGVGNVPPGAPAPKSAESSFYLGGSVYATLLSSDALMADITAQQALATAAAAASEASNVASGASAASSAASAAAAIVTLSTSLLKANNLSDLQSVATAKTNLSLVKADVGLGSVDNTSDANKPVSTAQATAIGLKANIASPTFTGVPAGPTATPGTNTTQLASTAFVEAARVILAAADALKAPLASPALTGTPTAPTAAPATNTTQLATTAFVEAARVILAAADALKAPLASPTLTGTPAAPTASPGTNTTQLATTAFVEAARVILAAADALKAPIASPTFTGVPAAPTATAGTNTTQLATTAFVTSAIAGAGVSSIAGNTGAFTLSGLLTNSTNVLKVDGATKSDQQTGTSTVLAATPANQQHHDSAIKAWVLFTGSTGAILASSNIASVTRNSAGSYTIAFTTAFASANYVSVGMSDTSGTSGYIYEVTAKSASSVTVVTFDVGLTARDPSASVNLIFCGRQ